MSEMLAAGLLQAIEAIFNENAFESIYDEVLFTCGQIGADSEKHAKELINSSIWPILVACLQSSNRDNLRESTFAVTLSLEMLSVTDAHDVLKDFP